MDKIRVTKSFRFEMAHVLKDYDGPCRNIHGHSYELQVTVMGSPEDDLASPKLGMVIDFGELKKIVNDEIIDKFDHAFVMSDRMSDDFLSMTKDNFDKVVIVPYQPTSEMMLLDFVDRIKKRLPSTVSLYSMMLRETATSFAIWNADDN